jgi:glycosyltransferase involved in cell wall biosynthesis
VALLCRELGGPAYSFTVHGPEEFDKPQFLKLREKVRRSAFAVAISSFGRSQLWRWCRPEDWPKVQVVRCGVDAELLRAKPTEVPSTPRFVCVGRLVPQKGHLLLVEAAARLASEGADFEIVVAGDGPLRPAIEAAIERHGLRGRVKIAGWMSADQVRETIVSSRAMVQPSFAEGLPVVVMEALALGRPVITTAIAGIPELVEPGVTGWLIPAGAIEPLVDAMRAALAAPPERLARMGRAGAERVARHHDVGQEARKLAELFGKVRQDEAGASA